MPFDELEQKKNTGEEELAAVEKNYTGTTNALADKEKEAEKHLEKYEDKVKKWKELDEYAKGMTKELDQAISEYKDAKKISNAVDKTFQEFEKIKSDLASAKERVTYVKNAPTRQPEADEELKAVEAKCEPLDAIGLIDLDSAMLEKNETRSEAQDDVNSQKRRIAEECGDDCDGKKKVLGTKERILADAEREFNEAVQAIADFKACPGARQTLSDEKKDLSAIMLDHGTSIRNAEKEVTNLVTKSQRPEYDKIDEKKIEADRNFKEKKTARDTAKSNAKPPEDVKNAKAKARNAKLECEELELTKNQYEADIGSLEGALKELEQQRIDVGARVCALKREYQKQQAERNPKKGSTPLVVGMTVLGVIVLICVIAAIVGLLWRRKAKKGDEKGEEKKPAANVNSNSANSATSQVPVPGSTPETPAPKEATPAPSVAPSTPQPPDAAATNKDSTKDQDAIDLEKVNTPPYADEKVGTALLVKQLPETTEIEIAAKKMVKGEADLNAFAFVQGNTWLYQAKANPKGLLTRLLVVNGLKAKSFVIDANMIRDDGSTPPARELKTAPGITLDPAMCTFKASKQTGKCTPKELDGAREKTSASIKARNDEQQYFSPFLSAQKARDRAAAEEKARDAQKGGRSAGGVDDDCETPDDLKYNEWCRPMQEFKKKLALRLEELEEMLQEELDVEIIEEYREQIASLKTLIAGLKDEKDFADEEDDPAAGNIENPAADNIENPAAGNIENPAADNSLVLAGDNTEDPARFNAGGEGELEHEKRGSKGHKDEKDNSGSEKKQKKKRSKVHKDEKDNSGSEKKQKKKRSKVHKDEKDKSGSEKKQKKKRSKVHKDDKDNSGSEKGGSSRKSNQSEDKSSQDSRPVSVSKPEEEHERIGFNANRDFIFLIKNYKPDLNIWTSVEKKNEKPRMKEWTDLLFSLIKTVTTGPDPLKKYAFNFREQLLPILVAYTQIFLSNHKAGQRKFLDRPNEKLPTTIITDIHGNVEILVQQITEFGEIGSDKWKEHLYIFTGDLVDRGKNSLEVVVIVLLLYMIYPDNVVVLRGNHEFYETNIHYGFLEEMETRFEGEEGKLAHFFCNYAFAYMPLCCRVTTGNKTNVFSAHGGISPTAFKMEKINEIPDFVFQVCFGREWWRQLTHAIVWTDPTYLLKCVKNRRGAGWEVGVPQWEAFLNENHIHLFVRGHQMMENGFEFYLMGLILTAFACPNSEYRYANRGAVVHINVDGTVSFTIYVPYDSAQTGKMDDAQKNQFCTELFKKARAAHNANNLRIGMKGVEGLQDGGEVARDDTAC